LNPWPCENEKKRSCIDREDSVLCTPCQHNSEMDKQASDYEMKLSLLRRRWHSSSDQLGKVLIAQSKENRF